ncbi:MAG: YfcC family protein [Spirochaetaceae bacterium]|nr:YfcC family protein [Spirochaetaceae bacterium]
MVDVAKKKFKMPTALGILFGLIVVVWALGWVIPSGFYDYLTPAGVEQVPTGGYLRDYVQANRARLIADGLLIPAEDMPALIAGGATVRGMRLTPVGGTFTHVTGPQFTVASPFAIFTAPVRGFYDAVGVAFFIIVVGGLLGIINKSRAIEVGIAHLMHAMRDRIYLLIGILMVLFSIGGSTYGMAEETIAFYPILLPIIIAAGFDAMTGGMIILMGAAVGVLASTVNPFSIGVASGIGGISIGNGIGLRLIMWVVFTSFAIFYVIRYARKVKANPGASVLADLNNEINAHFLNKENQQQTVEKTTIRQKLILAVFALTFVVMIYGVIPWSDMPGFLSRLPDLGWWFAELSALFLASAIICGIIAGFKESEIASSFITGARDMMGVVIMVGVARGISILMTDAMITDTILSATEIVAGWPSVFYINALYWLFMLLTFFVPSSSGLATLSMPLVIPMTEMAGFSPALAITAFQSGMGIIGMITPTSAVIMGALMLSKIPYERYLKFIWKYLLCIFIMTTILLSLGAVFS